jgi:hypothetical protein
MSTTAPAEAAPRGERDLDLSGRLFEAAGMLVSSHAERAQKEATDDAKRVMGGVVLIALAGALALPVVLLVDVALAVLLVENAGLGLASALGAVAASNALVALLALRAGKARLDAPVLKETRATIKRAAQVLRG